MKVVSVEKTVVSIPFSQPYYWAAGVNLGVNTVIIEIVTDEGIVGIGEACGDRSVEAICGVIDSAVPLLLGSSPFEIERFLGRFYKLGKWDDMRRFAHQALAGVEMALWDIVGQACGQPVHRLLGGTLTEHISCFGFLQGDVPEELARDARRLAVDEGFDVLYMKVGRGRDRDVACVRAVREAVGDETRLRIDANQAWQVGQALRELTALGEFDIEFAEQPVHWPDLDGMARLRASAPMPIAIDQGCFTQYDALAIVRAGAADVLVVGVHETGGLLGLKRVAAVAEAGSLPICRHGVTGETGITTLASLHVIGTIPNQTDGHQVMHQLLERDVVAEGVITFDRGRLAVPDRPGLGIVLDRDVIKHYAQHFQDHGPYYTRPS